MRISDGLIPGVLIIDVDLLSDERGEFARVWESAEILRRGLDATVSECSIAFNAVRGTLRGLHFQVEPYAEAKTIRCTAGAIFDVAVDLRDGSKTRHQWVGVELSATNRRSLFVPPGCAHGYLTLTDAAEVTYQISAPYRPEAARGHRYDDPAFGINWPGSVERISSRDASYPFISQH